MAMIKRSEVAQDNPEFKLSILGIVLGSVEATAYMLEQLLCSRSKLSLIFKSIFVRLYNKESNKD